MIDKEKIAAVVDNNINLVCEMITNSPLVYCKDETKSLMMTCLNKGIELALKSLWHDASEEPVKGKKLLGYDDDGYSIYCWIDQEATWKEFVHNTVLQKWCYISDILPQKGGEE